MLTLTLFRFPCTVTVTDRACTLSLTGGQVDVEALEALLEAVAGQQVAVDGVVLALQVVQLDEVVTDHAVHLYVGEASFREAP